jgi:hypothetical protein
MSWTWFARPRKAVVAKAAGRSFRPALESLEERALPTVYPLVFALDASLSVATASGNALGSDFQQQGPGSLTTTYHGNIGAMYNDGGGTSAPTIEFVPDSALEAGGIDPSANNNGTWRPLADGSDGSAPANYGAQAMFGAFIANAAARNLAFNLDTRAQMTPFYTLTPDASDPTLSHFASTQTLTATTGSVAVNIPFVFMGGFDLAGQTAANSATSQGDLKSNGNGSFDLRAPVRLHIDTTISGQPASITVEGVAVAHANIAPVVLVGAGVSGFSTTFDSSTGNPVNVTDPNASIATALGRSLTSLTLTIPANGDSATEVLAADPTVLAASGLSSSGLVMNPDGSYTLTISGTAAYAGAYQDVLRSITYSNPAPTDFSARAIAVQVTDDLGNTGSDTSTVMLI